MKDIIHYEPIKKKAILLTSEKEKNQLLPPKAGSELIFDIVEGVKDLYGNRRIKSQFEIVVNSEGDELIKKVDLQSKDGMVKCQIYHEAWTYIGKSPGFVHEINLKLDFDSEGIENKQKYLRLCNLIEKLFDEKKSIIKFFE